MSTFFRQTAQAMIAKHINRFPLLKLDQVIDWQPIEQYLNRQRTRYLRDHRGRPAYPLLSMFKAVLLGQWHSLSDPELEHSLITRIDFNLFGVVCGRGRNPTLRLWPAIFSGEIDVFPSERRNMGQEIGR